MNQTFVVATVLVLAIGVGQAQSFRKTRMVDGRGRELPVELIFDKERQILTVKGLSASIAEVPYASIGTLSYEQASRRRVKEGAIVMLASFGAGGVVMLTKSKNHWLYIDYKDANDKTNNVTLKLDKSEYRLILNAAEEQTGKQVETLAAQKGRSGRR